MTFLAIYKFIISLLQTVFFRKVPCFYLNMALYINLIQYKSLEFQQGILYNKKYFLLRIIHNRHFTIFLKISQTYFTP